MGLSVRMYRGRYRLVDTKNGQPAKSHRGEFLDGGGFDDWQDARSARREAEHQYAERQKVRAALDKQLEDAKNAPEPGEG